MELGFTLGVLVSMLVMFIRKMKSGRPDYDERQILERGAAYKWAFLTVFFSEIFYMCFVEVTHIHIFEEGRSGFVSCMLAITVFCCYGIIRDAFCFHSGDLRRYLILILCIGVLNSIIVVRKLLGHTMLEGGKMPFDSLSALSSSIVFLVVAAVLAGKEIHSRLHEGES